MNMPVDLDRLKPTDKPHERVIRRIGVALGGGAARGWAHIGVFRELLAYGIVPSVVAGTSCGAITGAAYAAGRLDAFEDFVRSLSMRRVIGMLDVSFTGAGLMHGDRLGSQLQQHLGEFVIEDLPLPFTAIAAEISTGHEVWLKTGSLVEALRASYALPGIFEPVQIAGRWLFDGAVVNPVPVSVCRAMGADFVIAVNVGTDLDRANAIEQALHLAPGDPTVPVVPNVDGPGTSQKPVKRRFGRSNAYAKGAPGMANVMMEAFNISQDRIARARLAETPPDVMINAKLTTHGMFDFHRAADFIAHGRAAVQRAMPELQAHLDGHMVLGL